MNSEVLNDLLKEHPDRQLVAEVMTGFREGFMLGMERYPDLRGPCRNLKKTRDNMDKTRDLVKKEISRGHMAGPFQPDNPPMTNLVFSPLNLVDKAGQKGEFRLIQDLSYPYNEQSVNACIPSENSSVQYEYIDKAISLAMTIGEVAVAIRLDVKHAFRNLPLHVSQIRVLAFTLDGLIYLNVTLPFGGASSCLIFEKVAGLLQWIVVAKTDISWISHYLDDFIVLAQSIAILLSLMDQFRAVFKQIGMPLAEEKTLGSGPILEYLGFILNFARQIMQITDEKRQKCLEMIDKLLAKRNNKGQKVTVKELQKVSGSLNFLCHAIPAGKPFLMSMYKLTRGSVPEEVHLQLTHHRRLSAVVCQDLQVFRSFLVKTAQEKYNSIPFPVKLQVEATTLQFFADAASSKKLGLGCIFGNKWAQGLWRYTSLFSRGFTPNIAILELYAIVLAVELWAEGLAGRTVILRSDNKATVGWLEHKNSDIPAVMYLL